MSINVHLKGFSRIFMAVLFINSPKLEVTQMFGHNIDYYKEIQKNKLLLVTTQMNDGEHVMVIINIKHIFSLISNFRRCKLIYGDRS